MRRHARPASRASARRRDDPERPCGGGTGLPLDRLRGTLGGASEGLLQRSDRAEPEDAVDRADRMVEDLAGQKLRGADGRHPRNRRHRLLLLCGRDGLPRARRAPAQPRSHPARPRGARRPADLRRDPDGLAAGGTSSASPVGAAGARSSRRPRGCTSGGPGLFLGIGVLFIPLGAVISVVQALVLGGFGLVGLETTGESAGWLAPSSSGSAPR